MEITRIFDLLDHLKNNYPSDAILAAKKNGNWIKYSTDDYIRYSNLFSIGLLALGFEKGDKIATVTNNRPEWNFIDMGMLQVGIVHVPLYPTISLDEYKYILTHSDVKAVIISDKQLYAKLEKLIGTIPAITKVYIFNEVEGVANWNEIIALGEQNEAHFKTRFNEIKDTIKPEDLATIIYTSGTTGTAKGVMLSHRNLVTNFISTSKIQPLKYGHKVLSFLPLCHIYERMMNYHYQYLGISIYYAENMGTIAADLTEIKADGFTAVPRVLEKIYGKIVAQGKDLPWLKKEIFQWALKLGSRYELNGQNGKFYELKLKIADKLVFSKWRAAIGGRIQVVVSGGAALQPLLSRIFWAADIKVVEGYGLTETSPVIAVGYPFWPKIKFGTVGPILEGVEVKFDEEGEILVKGPNVMMGYYKDPEYTKQVFDEEGWFHTGDIGMMVDGEFLKITDRKKEIFKLSSGKYVAPQLIENKFKESIFIEQIMVVGENEKFASALISPNFNYLHFWASKYKIHYRDNEELIKKTLVIERIQREVDLVNKELGDHEKIKRFRLVCEEWSPQSGELSPTLKLRRNIIYKKYDHILREIFQYSKNDENGK
ncbi:MAG: long-chain fatty acid--CoA ligase [Bacteroidales bacterium]|jgi:long-chain acyl-CoA synthetase|nr:long-chain fatty acid--CoA ligase [Bacteroidales bacterium]MDI9593165.1 long-chain fatty acid--CoA ligase [Bacteroidota bacterium]OQC37467.1 MAG: Long-chain-fatty-acid--CoA ligase FadD15 [Bacteroidetes bacterium ADurb.Bin041]MCO6468943.1 long-chain fatty acid--CoA ligase [Bacteroidales bacterium]HNV49838.1 long-chain fatty acid--CoA ligase [Bacteroidales bacterium]